MSIALIACSSAAASLSDSEMLEYVESDVSRHYTNRTIENIEILERETPDTEPPEEIAWVQVISKDSLIMYTEYFHFTFVWHEDEERWASNWVFDGTRASSAIPLAGVSEEDALNSLSNLNIDIDGENWPAGQIARDISIIAQDTDLENGQDSITMSIELIDDVLAATGEVQLDFRFDGQRWGLYDTNITTPFVSSFRDGKELILTDEELISVLNGEVLEFGSSDVGNDQYITIFSPEVSEFNVSSISSSNRATIQTYNLTFLLDKNVADFSVDATIIYEYQSGGWMVQGMDLTSSLHSVNTTEISGRWSGTSTATTTRADTRVVHIDISDIADDGTFSAILDFPNYKSNAATGFFNVHTLQISINFTEWIGSPPLDATAASTAEERSRFYEPQFEGALFIEELAIRGRQHGGQSNGFDITRQ